MPKAPNDFEERIDLPNGESVWYIDTHPTDPGQNHSYWRHNPKTERKGRRLTGVTTAVKTLDYSPDNLLKWAARTQMIGVADLYKLAVAGGGFEGLGELDWLSTPEAIWRKLEEHALTFEHVRDRAAKRGTNVHEVAFQALGMGRPVPDLERLTEEERGHARAIMAFWLDQEPKPVAVEQVVYSDRLGIAGRLDFLGTLNGFDGLCVVDAKTGKYISAAAHAQVGGGYPLLAVESGLVTLDEEETRYADGDELIAVTKEAAGRLNSLLLQTREDGTYELVPAEATPEDFESAVATYRAAGKINGAAGRARKARQTAREQQAQIDHAVAVSA